MTKQTPRRNRIQGATAEVRFEVDGQTYAFRPSVVTSWDVSQLPVGTRVTVAYDPQDPSNADLAEPLRLYAVPVAVTLLCAGLVYSLLR